MWLCILFSCCLQNFLFNICSFQFWLWCIIIFYTPLFWFIFQIFLCVLLSPSLLLMLPLCVFHFLFTVVFSSDWFYNIFSNSLLKFLLFIHVSQVCFLILLLLLWTLFGNTLCFLSGFFLLSFETNTCVCLCSNILPNLVIVTCLSFVWVFLWGNILCSLSMSWFWMRELDWRKLSQYLPSDLLAAVTW